MSRTESDPSKRGFFARAWRFIARPSTSISLGALIGVGVAAGVLSWGGLHWAVELSNTETFCISCHEMRDNVYTELKGTVHFTNRTGVRAICSDCHVPKAWLPKMIRKVRATNELYHKIMGTVNTPEKFEAHRLELAMSVWKTMKANDSLECRNCHENVWMDMSQQWGGAVRNHDIAIKNDLTCIDCHQGVAHKLPAEFKRPSPEQLAEDANGWLTSLSGAE